MANISGVSGTVLPGAFSEVFTASKGVSVRGGTRVVSIIGEGSRGEIIVSSALGGGKDGFNSSYTSTSGADSRHFTLSLAPVISNRTKLYKNGQLLVGLEASIDNNSFNNRYDYRIDISLGRIELQKAYIINQGGSDYSTSSTNVGQGSIQNLSLIDLNAPTETWTIKCVSVQRDNSNNPIANTAKFVAFGSISGTKLDSNGNPVVWIANNQLVNNSILNFSILESTPAFREGDSFTIKVKSGALNKNDSLTASYIPEITLNDPEFISDIDEIAKKHGVASLDNNLTLGCELAFANGTPGVLTLQAKPPIPRRSSYELFSTIDAGSVNEDTFKIPLPFGVQPDNNSNIHFFITNTSGVETQISPNKLEYYTLDTSGYPTTNSFIFDDNIAPSGYSYYYTVVSGDSVLNFAMDGYINRSLTSSTLATFSSSITFDNSYVGKKIKVINAINHANNGTFDITAVSNGKLSVSASGTPPFSDFVNETSVSFMLINPVTGDTVIGSTGTDGILVATPSTSQASFTSTGVDFSTFTSLTGLKLKITTTTNGNDGLYDIVSYVGITNTLTIQKSFVSENDLEYEILDPTATGYYLVLNHNVVPDGNSLRVTLVDYKDADFYDAGWINALETLEAIECDILVPLPKQTYSVIFQNALTHCKVMSDTKSRKERILFTGAIKGLKPDNLTGAKPAAVENIGILEGIQGDDVSEILSGNTEDLTNYSVSDAFGNTFRCVYFYPDEIVVNVGGENTKIDGFYIAAAAGGYMSGMNNISVPLTNKVLSGFSILRDKQFAPKVLENLVDAGVCVLQPVQGGGTVIWGKTTTQSGFPEEEEISIIFIRDRIAKSMRAGFAGFVGQPEDPDTIPTLQARATGLLNGFVSQKLITDYADLIIKRDTVDPRQWNVSVRVQPTYPINWIFIRVSVGLL